MKDTGEAEWLEKYVTMSYLDFVITQFERIMEEEKNISIYFNHQKSVITLPLVLHNNQEESRF
eukprot:snap_masked-scaffold_49-processed-gene-0.15-mRNA-1 protein AED:1.00 eAED:1.00 QI:0/-1/0/0/-1/1/1/0/62